MAQVFVCIAVDIVTNLRGRHVIYDAAFLVLSVFPHAGHSRSVAE